MMPGMCEGTAVDSAPLTSGLVLALFRQGFFGWKLWTHPTGFLKKCLEPGYALEVKRNSP